MLDREVLFAHSATRLVRSEIGVISKIGLLPTLSLVRPGSSLTTLMSVT